MRSPFARQSLAVEADVLLLPSTSSFDFLEGAFATAQRSRALTLGLSALLVCLLCAFALLGLNGALSTRSEAAALADATASNDSAVKQLAVIDNAEGISADKLTAHVAERQKVYAAAVGNEVDFVELVRQVRNAAPADVTVNSVKLVGIAPSGPVNAAPVGGAPTPAPTATTPAAGAGLGSVEIHGVVKDFALIGAWSQAIGKIAGLTAVAPTWSGGQPSIQVTIKASVTPAGQTARAKALTGAGKAQ